MKEYIPADVLQDAIRHAMECFPNESCGMVIEGVYKPYKNISKNPKDSFKIHPNAYVANEGKIDFIIHSHVGNDENKNDVGHASKSDMSQQIATNVPWCIIHINQYGNYVRHYTWGDQLPIQDLVGRPFSHGIYDCYSLMRDYYRVNNVCKLDIHPRNNWFWEKYKLPDGTTHKPEDLIMKGIKEVPHIWVDKKNLQPGDACFAMMKSTVVNHCAIYLGDGLILHHLYHKLSCREPFNRYKNYWQCFARYDGE